MAAIQRYQDDILGSQISQITSSLRSKLSNPTHSAVQTELALPKIHDALNTCHNYLQSTKRDLDAAFLDSCVLRDRIEEYTARAGNDVFKTGEGNKVVVALERAQKDLIQTMDPLTWWRLVWKVDEISTIVSTAVQTTWCHDLEKEVGPLHH